MTTRQRIFITSYLANGFNATQAAISAGYSAKTAGSQGERLLKNVEIKNAVDARLKEIESEQICKAEEILKFLSAVVRGEILDSVTVQVGSKSNFHAEILAKPPSVKDRLTAAATLAKLLKIGENEESVTDDIVIVLPPKNAKI